MPWKLVVVMVSLLLATQVVIFWLWLVIVPARVTILCLEGCHCDPEGTTVDCFGCRNVSVPLVNLTNVVLLNLFYNNTNSLEKDNYVSLTDLDKLDISACRVRTIGLGAFKGFAKLTKLRISQNQISEIEPGTFDYMNSLEYLDLNYNKLERLDGAVFSGLVNLKELYLKTNNLHYIHPGTFLELPNLQQLHLTSNPGLEIPSESLVSLTELDRLDISKCGLKRIASGAFKGLSKLTELRISQNEISEIVPGTLEYMKSLENIDLSDNRLQHLDSDMFSGLVNLKYIDLGYNNLQYLHPGTFLGLRNLQNLHLRSNPGLQIPSESFVSLTVLDSLDISKCGLETIASGTLKSLKKLTNLRISENEISEIEPGTLQNMKRLENLDYSYNILQHLDSDVFSGLVNLKEISLKGNKFQYLHPDTFLRLPNLQQLHLSFNPNLSIPTDRNFINSHSLSHLDISDCNISSVSVETFANVSALEWLHLGFNNLRTVDVNILRALPKLSTLYLNGNPLHCDSQLREVWRWCKDRNIRTEKIGLVPGCHTPSEVKGLCWEVLEKGQGSESNVRYCGEYNKPRLYDGGHSFQYYTYDVESFNHYFAPIYAVPFIFGTTGNVILLIIIICNKDMRTVPNMYILNLAISDIIYLTVLLSEAFAYRLSRTWLEGELRCTFFPFCFRMSVGLSAYSVAMFSFQRYKAIENAYQFRVSSPQKWRGTVATICGVWIVAALFAVPSALSKFQCEIRFISKKY
jgi:Leucine-rich repeat (LRR) protein